MRLLSHFPGLKWKHSFVQIKNFAFGMHCLSIYTLQFQEINISWDNAKYVKRKVKIPNNTAYHKKWEKVNAMYQFQYLFQYLTQYLTTWVTKMNTWNNKHPISVFTITWNQRIMPFPVENPCAHPLSINITSACIDQTTKSHPPILPALTSAYISAWHF